MQISKKVQQKPDTQKKEWKKIPYSMSTHRESYESLLSFGKYLHKTWGYVCREDPQYADWIRSQELLGSLGVLKPRYAEKVEKPQHFVTDTGEHWIGLICYNRKTTPAPAEWLS